MAARVISLCELSSLSGNSPEGQTLVVAYVKAPCAIYTHMQHVCSLSSAAYATLQCISVYRGMASSVCSCMTEAVLIVKLHAEPDGIAKLHYVAAVVV